MAKEKASPFVPDWEQPYKVPENWCWVYLFKGAAECLDTFRKPVNATERANREGDVPYYGATGQVGWIDDYLTDEELVLLGEDGAPFLDLIKDKAYLINGKAWVNNHAHILRSFYGSAGNQYLVNYLNSFNYKGYVNGTTRLKLTQASMETMPVPLAPLLEQQRIVDRIESLFAKLDEAKEKAQTVLDSFETRKAAILHKAFTGELTAKWRAEHNMGIESWKLLTYSDIGSSKLGKMLDKAKNEGFPVPYLRNINVRWFTFDLNDVSTMLASETEIESLSVKQGDLFICEGGEPGRCAIWKEPDSNLIFQKALHRFRPNKKVISEFLCYNLYFMSLNGTLEKFFTGTTIKHLTGQSLAKIPVQLPSVSEQTESVRILNSLFAKEQQAREAAESVLENIGLMKRSILARAFCGELGTNDPAEESAVELVKTVLEADAPGVTKKRSKSIPKELQKKLDTELERKIIRLYIQRETESLPAEDLLSVSSKKFDILESLHNLEQRGLIKKLNNGNYRLLG